MVKDPDERAGVAVVLVAEVALRDQPARHVVRPFQVQDVALERLERAARQATAPQSAGDRQEVEVRSGIEAVGRGAAVEAEAGAQQRHVERAAVERDETRRAVQPLGDGLELGALFGRMAHEELAQLEHALVKPADADQEGVRARAAHEPRRLGVQERGVRQIEVGQPRVAGQLGQCGSVDVMHRAEQLAAVRIVRGAAQRADPARAVLGRVLQAGHGLLDRQNRR